MTQIKKQQMVIYHCLQCELVEEIPLRVVQDFDAMDDGDLSVPPMFTCEECGGEMYPEYYKGLQGKEYRLSDIKSPK